jgi:hypothetical protein
MNSAHADLWLLIFHELQNFTVGQVSITKVTAHQSVARANTLLEEWCFTHNSYADQAANLAQWRRPDSFWTFFAQHVNATCACQKISRDIQNVLLAISRAAIRDKDTQEDCDRSDLGAPTPVPANAWKGAGVMHFPAAAVKRYGDAIVREVMSWFFQAVHGSQHEVVWVSQFHLYVDFLKAGGMLQQTLVNGNLVECILTLICLPYHSSVELVGCAKF